MSPVKTPPNPTLEAALRYAEAGLAVLPVHSNSPYDAFKEPKEPIFDLRLGFTSAYQTATGDPRLIRNTWSQYPRAWVAITGPTFEAVDIDNKCPERGADALLEALEEHLAESAPGLWERLLIERTQGGGYHLGYQCETIEGKQKLAHWPNPDNPKEPYCLIEAISYNGYLVVAPSAGYTLLRGDWADRPAITPEERAELLAVCRSLGQAPPRKPDTLPSRRGRPPLEEGERPGDAYNRQATPRDVIATLERGGWRYTRSGWANHYLTRPGKPRGTSASVDSSATFYCFTSSAHPFEPMTAYSPFAVYTTVEHGGDWGAAAKSLRSAGYGDPLPSKRPPSGTSGTSSQAQRAQGGLEAEEAPAEPWGPPLPLTTRANLPTFPTDSLTPWLRDMALGLAESLQMPACLTGMYTLAALSAAVGGKLAVRVRDDYTEPTNLYVLVQYPPGGRKSGLVRALTAPHDHWEREERDRLTPEIRVAESQRRILEAALKGAEAQAAKGGAEAQAEAESLARELAGHTVPTIPQAIVDDVTAEKLAGLLHDNRGRVAILSAEGGIFATLAGLYSQGVPKLDTILKGHAGDTIRVARQTREGELIHNPALTIGLAVQPDVVATLAQRPGFRALGLTGRFLYACPTPTLGYRRSEPTPLPEAVRSAYHGRMLRLLRIERPLDHHGTNDAIMCGLREGAYRLYIGFAEEIELLARPEGGRLRHMTDWALKLPGAMLRIAGLLHAADRVEAGDDIHAPLEGATVVRAIEIARYLIPHALAAYDSFTSDAVTGMALRIIDWLTRTRPRVVTRREIHIALRGHVKRADALTEPIELLMAHGYLAQVAIATRGPGRPSEAYAVNPRLGEGEEEGTIGTLNQPDPV